MRTIYSLIRLLLRQRWFLLLLAWLPLPGRLGKLRRALLPLLRALVGRR